MTQPSTRFAVQRRFFRSVHVVSDATRPDACDGYVVTPLVRATLRRIVDGIAEGGTARAWTLTGPYGAGKSAFVVLLAQWMTARAPDADSPAARAIRAADRDLDRRFRAVRGDSTGFCPVLVSGTYGPLLPSLLDAVERAVRSLFRPGPRPQKLLDEVRALRSSRAKSADLHRRVVALFEDLADLTCDRGGCGVLLVVDELGKTLEHAAHTTSRVDEVFLLQELAEAAARSGARPLVVVTLLHQSFDRYARDLTTETRAEWVKVQGRFDDVAFLDAPGELLRLAARAIQRRGAPEQFAPYDALVEAAVALGLAPAELAPTLRQLAPLHPTVALVLPALCRGPMAQNERSLFGFLTSNADGAFGAFLARDVDDEAPTYTLDLLYDFIAATLGPAQYTGPAGRRWAAVDEAIARLSPDAPPLAARLVKAIGLLGLLGSRSVRASRAALCFALATRDDTEGDIARALDDLAASSHVVYRRHSDAFALWEGSDIDLDAHFDAARSKAPGLEAISALLHERMVLRPWVARRHFIETGTLRYFDVTFATPGGVPSTMASNLGGADGRVVYLLPDGAESHRDLVGAAAGAAQRPDVVIGVPREARALLEGIHDWCAWEAVRQGVADLAHDPVARRELSARSHFASARLDAAVQTCFGLSDGAEVSWVHAGAATDWRGARALSSGLSRVCDQNYADAPWIRNELLNRRALSSAAAAARRTLLDAMLTRGAVPGLGIEGTPPERSMYASLLAQGELHRERDGVWGFGPPPADDPLRLMPTWRHIESFFDSTERGARPLRELFVELGRPPIGLREGPIPVIFFAAVLSMPGEVALFEEGSFVPEISDAVVERLLRRIDHFTVARHRLVGARRELLRALWAMLGVADTDHKPIDLTRAIVRRVGQLPRFSRGTRGAGATALAVRDAVLAARDPLKLLFDDLPRALGRAPVTHDGDASAHELAAELGRSLDELAQTYPTLLAAIERRVADRFGVPGDQPLRGVLAARAKRLTPLAVDLRLRAFLGRAIEADAGRAEWIEGLAMVVGNRPPSEWSDGEFARFEIGLEEIHALFVRAEGLAAGPSRAVGNDDEAQREILRFLEDRLGPRRETWVAALGRALESIRDGREDTP